MGLKDRIQGIRQYMSQPITLSMLEQGSDAVVTAGQPATVKVKVEGANDGTVEAIDLSLRYTGGASNGYELIPLGQVPLEPGFHELTVAIPATLPPSVAKINEYSFFGKTKRSKGIESDAVSPVDVIGLPEHLHWPDGPRTGQTAGEETARLAIDVDAEAADLGGTFSGTVSLFAAQPLAQVDVRIEAVAVVTWLGGGPPVKEITKERSVAEATLASSASASLGQQLQLPFKLQLPDDAPPTVHSGGTNKVVWQLRVTAGKASAWRTVGVLDPTSAAGNRHHRQGSSFWLLIDGV